MNAYPHKLAVAPMMALTDRHCRYVMRLLSKHILLYTEMVTMQAIVHGHLPRLLSFHPEEQPLALQVGGNDPATLAHCAKVAEQWGYTEINLNIGCPSQRVQAGAFGLCLMAKPTLVAACLAAMKAATTLPVTAKIRIGYDDQDQLSQLIDFVGLLLDQGTDAIWVHARKGWLKGLSPKENRDLPPLDYDRVYQLKRCFPKTYIGINGGIKSLNAAELHLQQVDGVMLGRAAYYDSYLLSRIDQTFYHDASPPKTHLAILEALQPYLAAEQAAGTKLSRITRHLSGLFYGLPNARLLRQALNTIAEDLKAYERLLGLLSEQG